MKFTVAWLLINLWLYSIAINFNFNTFIYCITFLYLPFPASRAQGGVQQLLVVTKLENNCMDNSG